MAEPLVEDVAFLEHFGRKGMKWGVRKRRNEAERTERFRPKTAKERKASLTKRAKKLSDDDLKTAIGRMELEKKYVDLSKGTASTGKKYSRDLMENSGKTVVGAVVGGVTGHLVKNALTKKVAS